MAEDPGIRRRNWMRSAGRAVAVLVGAPAALVGLLWSFQRRLLYFPTPGPVALPDGVGIREVDLAAADGVALKAWYLPGDRPATLLVLHGNAGDRGGRLEWARRLRGTGAGVFILDYRGYGGSRGSPSEEGLYLDAEAAEEWLRANVAGDRIYIGESLGTAVAVELALWRPPTGVVLQAAFTSAADVGKRIYPILPVGLLLRDRFDSLSKIGRVRCPILFVHGTSDSLVPIDMARALRQAARAKTEFLEIPGADHNDPIWEDPSYIPRLKAFLGL